MPPKKKQEEPTGTVILGRASNNLKIGIVGLPNVGKSLTFSILSKISVDSANYPFCTIEPNEGRVLVPDERFDHLCEHFKPASKVPAVLNITDIAGLVRNAHEGQGLGNAFLSNIQQCDAIFHVCRAFDDDDVVHVEDSVDPVRDLEIIADELRLKDIERLEKYLEKLEKITRQQDKSKKAELVCMQKALEVLQGGKHIRHADWKAAEIEFLNGFQFLTAKRGVFLVNLTPKDFIRKKNKWLPKIKAWIDEHAPGEPLIPYSAPFEADLVDMDDAAKAEYCKEKGANSMLPKIIKTGYTTLNLINFFTCGADEVRAWTIRRGTKAPQAAGVIHTDFMNGFIMAECYAYEDLVEHKDVAGVKAAGKYKQQGKNYEVPDGTIIFFKANTGAGLKK